MSWPIRGLSLDLRAQGLGRARAARVQQRGHPDNGSYVIGAVADRPCRHELLSFRGLIEDFENGALRPQG